MSSAAPSASPLSFAAAWQGAVTWSRATVAWARRRPLGALCAAAALGTLGYFFAFYRVFMNGAESTALWTVKSWNPENDLDHGFLILPVALFLVWWHRRELAAAPKGTSWAGLAIALFGIVTFIFAVRTLQGRLAILAFPLILYGSSRFLWGRATARLLLFPCAFLLFMVPLGFLVSRTVALQNLAASVAAHLSALLGIHVVADGATLRALDGSFNFEVSGGCSGIRSLTAMTMLAALYAHFTQRGLGRKLLLFASSLVFALLGNFARIFSVVLFAHYLSVEVAGTIYHDWSGFIFFPIAVGAMIGFGNLLNRDWSRLLEPEASPAPAESEAAATAERKPNRRGAAASAKSAGPISYDY